MSIVVYYLTPDYHCDGILGVTTFRKFKDEELSSVLQCVEYLRKSGYKHVCMSTEFENSVGKPGVDSIENGKTPGGEPYEWSKKHRGEGPKIT